MEVLTEQKWWFNVDIVGKDIVKKTVSFRRILKDRKQNLVVGPFFWGVSCRNSLTKFWECPGHRMSQVTATKRPGLWVDSFDILVTLW